METVYIRSTDFTPKVLLSTSGGIISVCGESLPGDAFAFYAPIIEWLNKLLVKTELSEKIVEKMTCRIQLQHINSSSTINLMHALTKLENLSQYIPVSIQWEYDDSDMKDTGEHFASLLKIPFLFVEIEKNTPSSPINSYTESV